MHMQKWPLSPSAWIVRQLHQVFGKTIRSLSDFPLPKRIDSTDNKPSPHAVMAHESIHPGRP